MKITKMTEAKNKLMFKIEGENHTFCNLLKDELSTQKGVVAASYYVEHPLVGVPQMTIETDGSVTPKKALEDAVKRIKKGLSEAIKLIEKEL